MRFVTVNMFETVFDEVTWDIHGSRPFTDVQQMAKEVAPNFDNAYTALLEDLAERGLLSNTMVVALGEFGRTPKINPAGGRDHHPGVWSILIGGGPIKGGQVIGESDELAYAPEDATSDAGRSRRDALQGPRPRPAPRTPRPTEPAAAAGRVFLETDQRVVLNVVVRRNLIVTIANWASRDAYCNLAYRRCRRLSLRVVGRAARLSPRGRRSRGRIGRNNSFS